MTVVVADVVDDEAGLPDTPVVGGAAAEQDAVPDRDAGRGPARRRLADPGGARWPGGEAARREPAGRTGRPRRVEDARTATA